jgi:hypothetical protein
MLVFGATAAQAVLLIGNLDNDTIPNQGNQVNGADNEFVSFRTPNDGITRTVDDISFFLGNSGLGTASFTASFIWYNDSLPPSGDPTGVTTTIPIGSQSVSVTAGLGTTATFVPSSPLTLLPNTLYGLRLNGTAGSGLTAGGLLAKITSAWCCSAS